jgi:ABC-type amino acid transport system permease subunit
LLFETLAILDQVSNTEGVSYTVFITALAAILGSFIATIGVLTNMVNTRMIRIEDKLDKMIESLFLIKASLGIITVAEKPPIEDKK